MSSYYRRRQVDASYSVARTVLSVVLVMLMLALVQTCLHADVEQDLAQLTPAQRAEIVSRWK